MRQYNIMIHTDARRRSHRVSGRTVLGFLLAAAMLLIGPGSGLAAGWLAPGSDQTVAAPWVQDLAAELNEAPYHDMFAMSGTEPPHSAVVHYLNGASQAIKAGNKQLARSYLDRALAIFDDGLRRGHYARVDVAMIKKLIRTRTEAAMKGEAVAAVPADDERWSGYTKDKPLGLTNEVRE